MSPSHAHNDSGQLYAALPSITEVTVGFEPTMSRVAIGNLTRLGYVTYELSNLLASQPIEATREGAHKLRS